MEIIKLKSTCKDYLWGGNRLRDYGKTSEKDRIAESWDLSVHPDGESVIASGKDAGMSLSEYIRNHPGCIGNESNELTIMIKLIDSEQSLSIQVHPDDEYALRVEHELGKTEMWYIIDADEDAFIYYGFTHPVSKEEVKRRIAEGTLTEILNKVDVHKGDYFMIRSGTVHAIGHGCLICEIQENSNTTYRLYDYNRVGKDGKLRPLHIEKALDVARLDRPEDYVINHDEEKIKKLFKCQYFETELIKGNGKVNLKACKSFNAINILSGQGCIGDMQFEKGDCFFIPAGYGNYCLNGQFTAIRTRI